MTFSKKNNEFITDIMQWTYPRLTVGKRNYIHFSAFDPETGKMKRKKIHLGRCKTKTELNVTSSRIIKKLVEKLSSGWNPWIDSNNQLEYSYFVDVCEKYREFIYKSLKCGDMREQTTTSYLSYLHIFQDWGTRAGITYIYQFDKRKLSAFLDYVYIERNNTLQTRNNYLSWLKVFSRYLLDRCYLNIDPTTGISVIKKRGNKQRKILPDKVLLRLKNYLESKNRYYLLACYLIHYCFIRPHEMSMLKIQDINLRKCTMRISGDISKNHYDAVITLPKHVIMLMLDLNIFDSPSNYYIFSDRFRPGERRKSEKAFRDFWNETLRPAIGLEKEYKFYSLKDTGITNMLRAKTDILSVRDQARHSNIAITDTYTPKDIADANELLINYKGVL